ncbi:unnamed protein product [Peniophora sp. CBMAI 1063]|nr:unnamed protein product [Peniophora sp. CBMAI 1063]
MVKSKSKGGPAWRPLKGALYKAIIRIHYFGGKEHVLKALTGRPPFTQRLTEDYDRALELRKDLFYLNLPELSLFEVRLNKHHHDCVELWSREVHHGDDDFQRTLIDVEKDIWACRDGYLQEKEISQILLFFVRSNFVDIAPNWNPVWHVSSTDRSSTVLQSPFGHQPGPSTFTRSSSPSRLSDMSGDVQTPLHSLFPASPPVPIPTGPRNRSATLIPSARWVERSKAAKETGDQPVRAVTPPTNGNAVQHGAENTLPGNHPESWTSVRPHLEDALKPLFDEFPQARPPTTASPFVMCRAIKTALSFHQTNGIQQSASNSNASEARVRELEAQLAAERSARIEAEAQCRSAEADLDVLREAHAHAQEELDDLRTEFKAPVLVPAIYQAFLGIHGMTRDLNE